MLINGFTYKLNVTWKKLRTEWSLEMDLKQQKLKKNKFLQNGSLTAALYIQNILSKFIAPLFGDECLFIHGNAVVI